MSSWIWLYPRHKHAFDIPVGTLYKSLILSMYRFSCTIFKPSHIALSSVITEFMNSLPLSLCKILGAPKILKISSNWYAISCARFYVTGRSCTNYVKWSWYTRIHLRSPSGLLCILIRSTCTLEFILLNIIGLITKYLFGTFDFLRQGTRKLK